MRLFYRSFFAFLLILLSFVLLMFFLGLESDRLVERPVKLSKQDVARIQTFLHENDPRELEQGQYKRLQISEQQVNLLMDYTASVLPWVSARSNIFDGKLIFYMTVRVPTSIIERYINIRVEVISFDGQLFFNNLGIGSLSISGFAADHLMNLAHRFLQRFSEYRGLAESVTYFSFKRNQVDLAYQWRPDLVKKLKTRAQKFLLEERDVARIEAYYQHLTKVSWNVTTHHMSMLDILRPLFQLASKRVMSGQDPVLENKALLSVFGMYAMEKDIREILGDSASVDLLQPNYLKVRLRNREDLTKHFLVSAAISVNASSGLADIIGLLKELSDSQGGSGFSFADLAADRAGVRFAQVATASSQSAKRLQAEMSRYPLEDEIMPRIDRLPEKIMALEFKNRFKDLDSASYQLVNNEVERRVAACRLYR